MERWPGLKLPEDIDIVGIYDKKGGHVLARKSLEVFKQLSEEKGAVLRYNTKVTDI